MYVILNTWEQDNTPRTIARLGQLLPTNYVQFYFGGFMLFYALWFDWLSIFHVSVYNSM